jgi:uncharacterized membrane protein
MPDIAPVGPHFSVVLNIVCAFVPLVVSLWLFRSNRRRNAIWWGGLIVMIAFLPTAPYTLTDIIHFIAALRQDPPLSMWHIAFVTIPLYFLYMFACFQAYVVSLLLLGNYLKTHGLKQWIIPSELILSFLSAIGIYLGRFQRLSSWDLVTGPAKVFVDLLKDFSQRSFLLFVLAMFLVITGLYYGCKVLDLALWRTYLTPTRSHNGAGEAREGGTT